MSSSEMRLVPQDMQSRRIKIGNRWVGDGEPVYVIGEIGINHNGDMQVTKKLIDMAKQFGADAVKFQKRTVDVVYTAEELAKPRPNPFGETNGDLKRGLEFGLEQYKEIDSYCKKVGIHWFASCWDEASVDFIDQFNPPCYKIASASMTDAELLKHHCKKGKPLIISTGMSSMEETRAAVNLVRDLIGDQFILMHTVSMYPCENHELNLNVLTTLRNEFKVPVGYSGHEKGVVPSVMAAAMGAVAIERHITLDRAMWGSDQAASLEPPGFQLLLRDIRVWEEARGTGIKSVHEKEIPIKQKLRRKSTLRANGA